MSGDPYAKYAVKEQQNAGQDPYAQYAQDEEIEQQEPKQGLLSKLGDYEHGLGVGLDQGVLNLLANIGNAPAAAAEYFTGKRPYNIPHADFLNQYIPQSGSGRFGQGIGKFIGGSIFPAGKSAQIATSAASKIPGISENAARLLGWSGGGAATGALGSEDNRLKAAGQGAVLGAAASTIPYAVNAGKSIYKYFQEPKRLASEFSQAKSLAQTKIGNAQSALDQFTQSAAEHATELEQKHLANVRKSEQNIYEQFPNIPESQANKLQVEAVQEGGKQLENMFNKRYSEFGNSEGGKRLIVNPIDSRKIKEAISETGAKFNQLKKQGTELSSHQIDTGRINEATGQPVMLEIPAKDATVNDYIKFYRETRDVASSLFKDAKNAPTVGEANALRSKAIKMKNLADEAAASVKKSLTPEENKVFETLQKDYQELMAPFKESRTLQSINKNKESSASFLGKMLQPRQERLHQYWLDNNPKYKQAIISSRLSGKNHPLYTEGVGKQADKIVSFLKTNKDLTKILSPDQLTTLQSHINLGRQEQWISKLKSAIKTKEPTSVFEIVSRSKIKGYNAKVRAALERIESASDRLSSLKQEAEQLNMSEARLKNMQEQREKIKKMINIGAKAVGIGEALGMLGKISNHL